MNISSSYSLSRHCQWELQRYPSPLEVAKEKVKTAIDDAAHLCQLPKGIEKVAKLFNAIINTLNWINSQLHVVIDFARVVWIGATQSALRTTADTFGAFHIFGTAAKWKAEFGNGSRDIASAVEANKKDPLVHKDAKLRLLISRLSLIFLAISDSFEAIVWLQKQKVFATPFMGPVINFFANAASKVGGTAVFKVLNHVTTSYIKNYTQVIGVALAFVECYKTLMDDKKASKHTSVWLKVASDIGKLGLIIFSGSLGFLAGYTGSLAFVLWALPSCIFPVIKLVHDHHMARQAQGKTVFA